MSGRPNHMYICHDCGDIRITTFLLTNRRCDRCGSRFALSHPRDRDHQFLLNAQRQWDKNHAG